MSTENDALLAMLNQYEKNNKPKYDKTNEKVYDLKNYFSTYMKDGIDKITKTIRILPSKNGSPFVEMYGHKMQVDKDWKTFACLKHEKNEDCPFCEAREVLLATKEDSDKETAKKYSAKLMYIVKIIDRGNEEDGVKFWRFNHDFRKEGILDKINGVISALQKDITNPETGRDLVITINRNQKNQPVVSSIVSLDSSKLSDDKEKLEKWLNDTRSWEDVYSVRNYDYLALIVKGKTPAWDNDKKCFVDKQLLADKAETSNQADVNSGLDTQKEMISEHTYVADGSDMLDDDLPF
jgi:hypothetical protein